MNDMQKCIFFLGIIVSLCFLSVLFLCPFSQAAVYGVTLGTDGRVYAGNYNQGEVSVFDKDLRLLYAMKIPTPHGLIVDYQGNLYVATHVNGRIHKFDINGKEILNWDYELIREKRIKRPLALTVDKNNNLFIADYELKTIIKASEGGKFLASFAVPDGKMVPHGITTDAEKFIYVADINRAIRVFSLNGDYIKTWPLGEEFSPASLCLSNNKFIIVANPKTNAIYFFDLTGKYESKIEGYGKVTSLVINNDGDVYMAKGDSAQIIKTKMDKILTTEDKIKRN